MRPSSLERRFLCPGSYRQERGKPDEETPYNKEGTRLHELVATALQGGEVDAGDAQPAVDLCVSFAKDLTTHEGQQYRIEQPLPIGKHIPGMAETGTPDLLIVEPYVRVIVIDWKFTHIDPPPADENLQLAAYAVAAALEYECPRAEAHICLAFSEKSSVAQMESYREILSLRQRLVDIVRFSLTPLAPLVPHVRACQYCRGKIDCPALLDHVSTFGELTEDSIAQLSAAEIALLLPVAKLVGKWVGALKQRAMAIALSGGELPGYLLKPGRRSRGCKDGVQLVDIYEALNGVIPDCFKPKESLTTDPALKTPAKIEKLMGGKARVKKALEPLMDYTEGSPQLREMKNDDTD